eukprot:scaffold221_cov351-Pavlova_lutheri.AAC.23
MMGSFPFRAFLTSHMCILSNKGASRANVVPPVRIGYPTRTSVSDTAKVCYTLFPSVNTKQDKRNPTAPNSWISLRVAMLPRGTRTPN